MIHVYTMIKIEILDYNIYRFHYNGMLLVAITAMLTFSVQESAQCHITAQARGPPVLPIVRPRTRAAPTPAHLTDATSGDGGGAHTVSAV